MSEVEQSKGLTSQM